MRSRATRRALAAPLFGCSVWLAACVGTGPAAGRSPGPPLQLQPRQIIVGVPLVTPALRSDLARRIARQYDLILVGAFPLRSVDVHCVVYEVPRGSDLDELTRELSTHPEVRIVQRNQQFTGMADAREDPYASFQYGARTLRAFEAHRWATGKGVRVGVIDTGVDVEHPDLEARIVETRNFVENGEESFSRDVHGTAVAGIIAARADNGEGILGIAPDADLVVGKACWQLDATGDRALCSSWTLARAVDFAIRAGVQVLNLSLAGPEDPLLRRLLAAADEAGIAVVAAAGDDAHQPGFPASQDSVIAVVSSDVHGSVPELAWQGASAALAAPGQEILTTAPGARYRFLSGSSLSTAHVSGTVALLLERDPELSPADVSALLRSTAHEAKAARTGSRVRHVDACAAIRRLSGGEACAEVPAE